MNDKPPSAFLNAASAFRRMAHTLEHNDDGSPTFGGAAVIIPPTVTGVEQPIELLLLDAQGDPAQFFATISSRLQIMVREIDDKKGLYGR